VVVRMPLSTPLGEGEGAHEPPCRGGNLAFTHRVHHEEICAVFYDVGVLMKGSPCGDVQLRQYPLLDILRFQRHRTTIEMQRNMTLERCRTCVSLSCIYLNVKRRTTRLFMGLRDISIS
jgi:hypothetical protein